LFEGKGEEVRRVCFDIETEPFSKEFGCAVHIQDKLVLAPKMRLACVFDGIEWHHFTANDAPALIEVLSKANEVTSFTAMDSMNWFFADITG
jgi:hypothetical protein